MGRLPFALAPLVLAAAVLAGGCAAHGALVSHNPCAHDACGQDNKPTPTAAPNPIANDTAIAAQIEAACVSGRTVAGCESASIAGLNAARAGEGLPADTLPVDFWSLPYDEQLFDLVNQERVSRGLPPFTKISPDANSDALLGAQRDTDPPLTAADMTGPGAEVGNWAGAVSTTVEAVFLWVYDDGPGSGNSACNTPAAAACWGHRDNTLENWAGASFGPVTAIYTMTFGAACAPYPQGAGWYSPLSCAWEGYLSS